MEVSVTIFCFPLQDIEYIETVYEKMFKLVERGGDKKLKPEYDCICKIRNMLMEEKKQIRFADWDTKEVSGFPDSQGRKASQLSLVLDLNLGVKGTDGGP